MSRAYCLGIMAAIIYQGGRYDYPDTIRQASDLLEAIEGQESALLEREMKEARQ